MKEQTFETSLAAYNHAIEHELIGARAALVLKALVDATQPLNQRMVYQAIVKETGTVGLDKDSVSPRFSTLLRLRMIREVGKGKCPLSGRQTMFYEATTTIASGVPLEIDERAERRASLKTLTRENAELKRRVAELEELLNMRSAAMRERDAKIKITPVEVQTTLF